MSGQKLKIVICSGTIAHVIDQNVWTKKNCFSHVVFSFLIYKLYMDVLRPSHELIENVHLSNCVSQQKVFFK